MHTNTRLIVSILSGCLLLALSVRSQAEAENLASETELFEGPEFQKAFNNPKDDPDLPNVLIIGDSISVGYTVPVRKLLKGKADVFRTDINARYTHFGLNHLDRWIGQRRWDVIHFNWGLWDICYRNPESKVQGHRDKVKGTLTTTPEAYREAMTRIIAKLNATDAALIWCETTPVPEHEAGRKVGDEIIYNKIAAQIVANNDIVTNPLHAHALRKLPGIMRAKGDVHFTEEGYEHLALKVAEVIEQQLAASEASDPAAAAGQVVRLWPIERVGGEQNRLKEQYRSRGNGRRQLAGVKDPNITLYRAAGESPTPAVIYCPAGGYGVLSLPTSDHIKAWNGLGVTLVVLKYTIPKQPDKAFEDIQRAVRMLRHNAERWNIDPDRIGVFGSSAGGHLSARLSNNFDLRAYEPIDEIDEHSCEPNFVMLQSSAYFNGPPKEGATTLDQNYFHLKRAVAPTFITYAKDDSHYPGGRNYTDAMRKAGYPIHPVFFEKGGHGMNGCDWFTPLTRWLKKNRFVD